MVDNVLSGALGQLGSAVTGKTAGVAAASGGGGSGLIIGIAFFIGIAVVCIVGAFIWMYFSEKKQWKILIRAHYENPAINGISFGSGTGIPTKRIRFKDGRVVYIYKTPIQGYTISPELLNWTRPGEHDVIITQDKKLFVIMGITGIDIQRKLLKVDIAYPDIEMDRQDLQKHIDSKKYDDPNERFKIMAKIATYVFVGIVIIVLVVLGSKAYIEGKNIDLKRDQLSMQTAQTVQQAMNEVNTFVLILNKVMPQSFASIDGQNLLNRTIDINS